ncbi:MAG: alpha/beta hydrolase [Gammaproteobacteria bacterium]|nr:alpha/beta hydrolase [Gammaproteobacteria bacterium]
MSTPTAVSFNQKPITGTLRSATGCRLDFRLYKPNEHPTHDSPVEPATLEARKPALVILGHGFLRSQERMSGLAKALATQGISVATLDFCNMRPWDGRHQQNGLDMIALAEHLKARVGAGQIVYSGFSAGGLAALIAARNDPYAIGAVTLDLVDAQGIGRRAARELDKPLLGLAGEPTNCNAGNNARAVFAASDYARVQPIPGAGHCDFEAPTDALCEFLCEDPDNRSPAVTATLREQIIVRATEAIESMIEDKPSRSFKPELVQYAL